MIKQCIKCKEVKSIDQYPKHKSTKDGYRSECKKCRAIYSKEWREQNPEQRKSSHLKELYNITLDEYKAMWINQKGCCKLCGNYQFKFTQFFAVDHNHKCCQGKTSCGKCIRGLLCNDCNTGLGKFKDNTDVLKKAINYINNKGNI